MAASRKILVLGASSWVGRHLMAHLDERARGTYNRTPVPGGFRFDALADRLRDAASPGQYSHAVLLLADPQPDSCFADPIKSRALNVEALERILEDCFELGIVPVFISTEFVFDGMKGQYVESDEARPILLYGRQKLEVERWLRVRGQKHVILRLAKVFGDSPADGTLFSSWIRSIRGGSRVIRCAADQAFSPVFVGDACAAIMAVIDRDVEGLFHLSGGRRFRRIELLEILLKQLSARHAIHVAVEPCSIHDFPLPEKRPVDVSMRVDRLAGATGIEFCDIEAKCANIVAAALAS